MNSTEDTVPLMDRPDSIEPLSSNSSRPMSTDPNNTMARLEKVKSDRMKRMSFTRESPVISPGPNRPVSMKLTSSNSISPKSELTISTTTSPRPSSMRLTSALSPRSDASREPSISSPPATPMNANIPLTAVKQGPIVSPRSDGSSSVKSSPHAHKPLSDSTLNSTLPLLTPTHLQGNDTLDSIEYFLRSNDKHHSIRSDVAINSVDGNAGDDHRDGFERALLNDSLNISYESSDAPIQVISPKIPSMYTKKSPTSDSNNNNNNLNSVSGDGTTALVSPRSAPVFSKPKELPPTLSQENMRKPSLTAQEFMQLIADDSSLSVLEQVKRDRLGRRTNTDPSITAINSLSRSHDHNESSISLAQSVDSSSIDLKPNNVRFKDKDTSNNNSGVNVVPPSTSTVTPALVTPANLQSDLLKKQQQQQSSTSFDKQLLMSSQKKLMPELNDVAPPEVSPSSVVSVGYVNTSYVESSSTFVSPMGNPLPVPRHNEELNQKIIAAMMAMNEKMAAQKTVGGGIPRTNSGNMLPNYDPRLRDPSDFLHLNMDDEERSLQHMPSMDSGDNNNRDRGNRGLSPLHGARLIRRVSIDAASVPPEDLPSAPINSPRRTASANSLIANAQSNYRTDLHLRPSRSTSSGHVGEHRSGSRSPVERSHSHSPIERRSQSPPPTRSIATESSTLSYNDSVPLIPDRDLAKLMDMGLSEEEAMNIYKEHVTMMLIPPEERATTGTTSMLNNSELKRKRRILLRTHHHKKPSHRSQYNELQWYHEDSSDNNHNYGSRRGSRTDMNSHSHHHNSHSNHHSSSHHNSHHSSSHHHNGGRSRNASEDFASHAIARRNSHDLFRTNSQQRIRLGSADHPFNSSSAAPSPIVRRSSHNNLPLNSPASQSFAVRRGSNGSMSHSNSVRGPNGGKVSRQGSLDLGSMRRGSHSSLMAPLVQERFRPGSVDIIQQLPQSRRGSHTSMTSASHTGNRVKSGSMDLTLHNYPARRHSREPVRRLSGEYGLGRIKMTKVNAAEIAANLLKTFDSLGPLKELLTSANGAAAVPTENRRSSVSTLFGEVDDNEEPSDESSGRWKVGLNEYLANSSGNNHHNSAAAQMYEDITHAHVVHRMSTLSEETEMS